MYWKAVLALSQFLSRQRLYWTDDLTCHFAGVRATTKVLRSFVRIAVMDVPFWQYWVNPVVNAGFRPALVESLVALMECPAVLASGDAVLALALKPRKAARYDAHPPLSQRLERLCRRADKPRIDMEAGSQPASHLVKNWEKLEIGLLQAIYRQHDTDSLRPLDWDTGAAKVFVPGWEKMAAQFAPLLVGLAVKSLPLLLTELTPLASKIPDPKGQLLRREQRLERAVMILRVALSLRLMEHGWTLRMKPGMVCFSKGSETVDMDRLLARLRSGEMKPSAWEDWCAEAGISGVDFNGQPAIPRIT